MSTSQRTDSRVAAYAPGTIVAQKYRVERTLGVGGFGVVLAAVHAQLEERVAIKILLPEAAAHPTAPSRFVREAKAAARIRSEHVARVTDVGQLEDGTPYMVMEYLEGEDLSALAKRSGGQPVADVCEWILQACEALAEAHGLGVVHRDLKPANLFLTRRIDGAPWIKVLDFGISKLNADPTSSDKGMTGTAEVMGSPFYMSPEQMKSTRNVDVRADVWALGTILFEMLAGQPPFDGETMTGLIVSIMQEPPREIFSYRTDVPPQLRAAILTCLQKDPAARFQDVLQLASALAPFAPPRAQNSLGRIAAALGPARSAVAPISAVSHASGHHASGHQPSGAHPSGRTEHGAIPAHTPLPPTAASPQGVTGGDLASQWARSGQVAPAPPRSGSSRTALWVALGVVALVLLSGTALAIRRARNAPPTLASTAGPESTVAGASPTSPTSPKDPTSPTDPSEPSSPTAAGDPSADPVRLEPAGAAADAPSATPEAALDAAPEAKPTSSAKAPPGGATVPPLGFRPGPIRPPPPPPPPKTSTPADPPPKPPPPADPFGKAI